MDLPGLCSGKESACQCRRHFNPWVRKILWKWKWQPNPVFLPGNPTDRGAWWATVHGVTKELDVTAVTEHIFYYGKGENTTFATTATGKIYSKNKSVQNKSVSELKKSTEKEDFT